MNSSKKTESQTWDEVVAKFAIHGITPWQLAKLTLKQVHYIMREWGEELKLRYKLAGWEVKEEDTQTINAGNADLLKNMINTAIRGK